MSNNTTTADNSALEARIAGAQAEAGRASVFDTVSAMAPEFAKALPDHMPLETFLRTATTELRTNEKLGQCSMESLLGAFMTAARLGLEVGGPLGHFYLTPRPVKGQGWSVVPIIGYKGLQELATRAGVVGHGADLVREGDTFRQGYDSARGGKFAVWEPLDFEEIRPVVGVLAYAVAGGQPVSRYLTIGQVMERKGRGAAGDRGPWSSDRDAMIRKTGLRALAADLPQSTGLALARRVDEQVQVYRGPEFSEAVVPEGAA